MKKKIYKKIRVGILVFAMVLSTTIGTLPIPVSAEDFLDSGMVVEQNNEDVSSNNTDSFEEENKKDEESSEDNVQNNQINNENKSNQDNDVNLNKDDQQTSNDVNDVSNIKNKQTSDEVNNVNSNTENKTTPNDSLNTVTDVKETEIKYHIVEDTAKLENVKANITKQSDKEYTISYPGVTEGSPLRYQEDFIGQLSHFGFSAQVVNMDGSTTTDQPHSLNMSNSNWDYSEITKAVGDDANIPVGIYTTTLDFSKITSNVAIVKKWKEIGFEDGSQVVTIKVVVGTKWADDSQFEPYKIKTVSPNNVKMNLFDYWVEAETAHTHSERGDKYDEESFLTCGIPTCIGETNKVVKKKDPPNSGYEITGYYNKGINKNHALVFSSAGNETGGWNFDTANSQGESFTEFNGGPYTNLVKNTLGLDGYPVLNLNQDNVNSKKAFEGQNHPADESLAYLFSTNPNDGKRVYEDVKGLLKRDTKTGNYKYSSLENFASLDKENKKFNVYNSWAVYGGGSEEGQFFPFNTAVQVFEDENGKPIDKDGILQPDETANGGYSAFINHYLGMTMDVEFQQPVDGKISNMGQEKSMEFRFTGDDDVWIFIDGVLVADLGGIHSTLTTTIDFQTGDVEVYVTNELEAGKAPRIKTTLKKQFETAGVDVSGFNGDTFADNTVHELQMFYMERGNVASNLELEFNLMQPEFNKLYKVDQDGNGLKGVTFGLYEADDKWQAKGEMIAELTTGEEGLVEFATTGTNGLKQPILFDENKKYVLKEIESLPGYVFQDDIHLSYHAQTGTLKVENKWETGSVGGLEARVTMTSSLQDSNGNDITEQAKNGLIVAVPLYNPVNKGAEAKEGWQTLYGSVFEGFKAVTPDESISNPEDRYRKMITEAIIGQFSNPNYEHWHLDWNDELERYEGDLEHLPSSVDKYIFVDKENGDMLMAYYLLLPPGGFFDEGMTEEEKCQKIAQEVANGNVEELVEKYYKNTIRLNLDNFNRQFYTNMYVQNKVRDLSVLKVDEYKQPIQGVEFTLFDDKDCKNPVAKGITDKKGYVSFSAQYTGNNIVTNPDGGLSSRVYYPLAQNRDDTGKITEKYLWLKETKSVDGYDINPTVMKVLVSNDNIYVDAGTKTDNVSVAKGIGKLGETMVRYASDDVIDITLRDITSTKYKYTGKLNSDGFPDINTMSNWKLDTSEEPLSLHFGLDSALLDYGVHEKDRDSVFETNEGWIGLGMKQNKAHMDKDDEYYSEYAQRTDLAGVDISALFTGSTVVVVTDKKTGQEQGNLKVSKEVIGNQGDKNKEFNFTITLDNENINYAYGDILFKDGVANVTLKHGEEIIVKGLPAGVTYTVEEMEANKDGYVTTSENAEGTIPKNKTAEVKFVNERNTVGGLSITKEVKGTHGDQKQDFHFTITLSDKTITGTYGNMEFDNGKAEVTLKHGETKVAENLPADITYEVEEMEANKDGYDTTSQNAQGMITEDTTAEVKFVNERSIVGGLSITKEVKGTHGDQKQDFHFTIILSDKTITGTYGNMEFDKGEAEVTLKHGETKVAKNLPADITYEVEEMEANKDGYVTTSQNAEGTITKDKLAEVKFVNERNTITVDPEKPNKDQPNKDQPHESEITKTDDLSNVEILTSLFVVSLLGIIVLMVWKKKMN